MSIRPFAFDAVMVRAVEVCIAHVDAGGLPFVGVLVDVNGSVASVFGVNRVHETGDPMAHAEVVAVRDAVTRHKRETLTGYTLLATGEPCGLCYRYSIDHGIEAIYAAVDRDEVAGFGFDYRASYCAFGITDATREGLFRPLAVEHGAVPFTRYLHQQLSGHAVARPSTATKGTSS